MRKLSTGHPSTLEVWYEMCLFQFGRDSAATALLAREMAARGPNAEVNCEERPLLHSLVKMVNAEREAWDLLDSGTQREL